MYIINAIIKVTDDQNEITTIESSTDTCVQIDESSGIVSVYNNCTTSVKNTGGGPQDYYTIPGIPCTIYRNLKKIEIIKGTKVLWKFIKFSK